MPAESRPSSANADSTAPLNSTLSSASNSADGAPSSQHGQYVVVARRYRPQSFQDLVGQSQVSQALGNAINTHRVGHAYLFTGARGVGKTSTARIFAKALNCVTGPTPTPCNQCEICRGVSSGDDVDVLEIDGASNRGIDEIRQLRSNVNVRPSRARYKIYIIDEVHMLTTPAFNALLKTLEEPPEHVKFIFCTTDPEKIPITVLSRCQRFDFPPVEADAIVERLRQIVHSEAAEADDEALRLLARRAAGSMRDSQSLLEQLLSFTAGRITVEHVHRMLGTANGGSLAALARLLVQRNASDSLAMVERAVREGVDVGQLAEQLVGYFRDVMAATVGCAPELLLYHQPSDRDELAELGKQLGLETVLAVLQILDQCVTRMRQSIHTRTLLEMALVRICKLEDLDDLAQLITRVQSGAPTASASPPAARAEKKTTDSRVAGPTGDVPPNVGPPIASHSGTADSMAAWPMAPQPITARSTAVQPENVRIDPPQSAPAPPAPTHLDTVRESSSSPVTSPAVTSPAVTSSATTSPALTSSASTSSVSAMMRTATLPAPVTGESRDMSQHRDMSQQPTSRSAPPSNSPVPQLTSADAVPETRSETRSETMAEAASQTPSDASASNVTLSSANARAIWDQALDQLEDMSADYGRMCDRVTVASADRLVVSFRHEYNLHKQSCEKPERRAKIEQALAQVVGRTVRVEFEVLPATVKQAARRPAAVNRVQRLREVEKLPLVQQAKALFDADILEVLEPRTSEGT